MSDPKYSLDNLRSILRIQENRLRKHEKIFRESQKVYIEVKEKVEQREVILESIRKKETKVKEYMLKDHKNNNYSLESKIKVTDVQYWINYDIEMQEYYLSQEKSDLEEKETEYMEKKQCWIKQRYKLDLLKDTYRKANITLQVKVSENTEQDELEDKYSRVTR